MSARVRAAAGVAVAVVALGLSLGLVPISPVEAWNALRNVPGSEATRLVLLHVRLPRVIVAWIVGSALSVSGCALQGVFRNPLADPSVLGVSAGAALGAQCLLFIGGSAVLVAWIPIAACIGAVVATLVLLAIVGGGQSRGIESLILGGIALGQLALAASALLLSFALADYTVAQRLLRWSLGSLDGRTWTHVAWGLLPSALGSLWIWQRARPMDALMLGEPTAIALGVPVGRLRRELVLAVALLSGISVAIGGIVAFVGLVVPHLVRGWVGAGHRRLVPMCWWVGGASVVAADTIARTVIAPSELQLGAVTAAVGAPWFIIMLRRRFREISQ